jgi:hypothetical protein
MNWKSIRLELARTKGFPQGSASRCYLLRLPLDERGFIDEAPARAVPAQASVRRFWPSQPDMVGQVIRTPEGWAFSYEPAGEEDERVFLLETNPFRIGNRIRVTEPDGQQLPFRVASVEEFRRAALKEAPARASRALAANPA